MELDWCKLCVVGRREGDAVVCFCLFSLRHSYENIKVQYHNILWQFCTIYCSTVYFHSEVSR